MDCLYIWCAMIQNPTVGKTEMFVRQHAYDTMNQNKKMERMRVWYSWYHYRPVSWRSWVRSYLWDFLCPYYPLFFLLLLDSCVSYTPENKTMDLCMLVHLDLSRRTDFLQLIHVMNYAPTMKREKLVITCVISLRIPHSEKTSCSTLSWWHRTNKIKLF